MNKYSYTGAILIILGTLMAYGSVITSDPKRDELIQHELDLADQYYKESTTTDGYNIHLQNYKMNRSNHHLLRVIILKNTKR